MMTDKEIERIADEEMKKLKSFDKCYDTRYGIILGLKLYRKLEQGSKNSEK